MWNEEQSARSHLQHVSAYQRQFDHLPELAVRFVWNESTSTLGADASTLPAPACRFVIIKVEGGALQAALKNSLPSIQPALLGACCEHETQVTCAPLLNGPSLRRCRAGGVPRPSPDFGRGHLLIPSACAASLQLFERKGAGYAPSTRDSLFRGPIDRAFTRSTRVCAATGLE